jgi:NADH dehydrogenase
MSTISHKPPESVDAKLDEALALTFPASDPLAVESLGRDFRRHEIERLHLPAPVLESRPAVVIVGGGFGGLYAARRLARAPVQVTVIDERNHHLFQPLLYQVATGGLSPANIATPLRTILRRQRNADVILERVVGFDLPGGAVILSDGSRVPYRFLVVASGSRHSYFGHPEWEWAAPGLKTIEDALRIRRTILCAFERADRETDPERRAALLSFAVVGAGPTGVELAGALADIARHALRSEYRHVDPAEARIYLLDALPRVLSSYPPQLSARAEASLRRLGVQVLPGATVSDVSKGVLTWSSGAESHTLHCETVLWAAGVTASPLGQLLARAAGAEIDAAGRVKVQPDFSLTRWPEVFVVGDLARWPHAPLPGIAPVAMQAGEYVADRIAARIEGKADSSVFRYRDRGSLATIGRAAAVGTLGRWRVWGLIAWLLWLVVHLRYLARAENRLLVFIQWAWSYVTYDRSARLITGPDSREMR